MNTTIPGVGREAPVVVNEAGGKQSHVPYRLDLLSPAAVFRLGLILAEGAEKYGEWNWTRIPAHDQINHALVHLFAYLAGDRQDDHLGHAACRLMFAVHVAEEETP